jgi:hypothetical protein
MPHQDGIAVVTGSNVSRPQVSHRYQGIRTEALGRQLVGNLQCVREIGAPAVMPWIAGQGRALHCGRVHGWPSGRDRSGAIL